MSLHNLCSVASVGPTEKLEMNLISMFDHGFVDKGGYFNVNLAQTGCYTNDMSALEKRVDARGVTYWEGQKNWVYHSGTTVGDVNYPPTIYVDGAPYTSGTINYRDGSVRIPGNPTSVKASYSYKWVSFTSSRKIEMFRRANYRATREPNITPKEIRMVMPFVAFDVVTFQSSKFWGLGIKSPKVLNHIVDVYVVGEGNGDVSRICDIISNQAGYIFNTFDPQLVQESGDYPLTLNGVYNSGKTHAQLSAEYPWSDFQILKVTPKSMTWINEHICQGVLRMETKLISCIC